MSESSCPRSLPQSLASCTVIDRPPLASVSFARLSQASTNISHHVYPDTTDARLLGQGRHGGRSQDADADDAMGTSFESTASGRFTRTEQSRRTSPLWDWRLFSTRLLFLPSTQSRLSGNFRLTDQFRQSLLLSRRQDGQHLLPFLPTQLLKLLRQSLRLDPIRLLDRVDLPFLD